MGTFNMASLLSRAAASVVRRSTYFTARSMSDTYPPRVVEPHEGKVGSDKLEMPDELGHSVGAQRYELLAKMSGQEDPFEMTVRPRAKGTREEPNLIPSLFDQRLVGCICEEDAVVINWMYLNRGEAKRCDCGYYFQMVDIKAVDL